MEKKRDNFSADHVSKSKDIRHTPGKFFTTVQEKEAHLEYSIDGTTMDLTGTYVPPEARGHNVADSLVREAVAFAESKNYKIAPTCSYVSKWFDRHPEKSQLIS